MDMVNSLRLYLLFLVLILITGCKNTGQFYPVGIYGAHDTNAFHAVRNAGFNTVISTATPQKLDQAESLGLKLLSPIGSDISKDLNIPKIRQLIQSSDSHPALLGYYLVDEPDLHRISPERVDRVHRFFKSYPAKKPTALIVFNGFNAKDYSAITDIFMIDRYPIPWLPMADFDLHIRLASNAIGPNTPLYTVLQAFDWEEHRQLLPKETEFRPPTEEEMRCMVYLSLSYGADGIFFYSYRSRGWFIEEHPEVWTGLQSITYEMIQRKPLFLAEPIYFPMDTEILPYENRLNEALSPAIRIQVLQVKKSSLLIEKGNYILAVNTTTNELKLRWKLLEGESEDSSMMVLDEFREVRSVGAWFEDDFGPYTVRIYGPF